VRIVSVVPGRVRPRVFGRRRTAEELERVTAALDTLPGVSAVRASPLLREVERDQRRLVAIPTLHDVADLGDHRVGVVGRLSVGAD